MIVRNSTIGAHINPTMPWQPWVGRTILAPYPDGGAPADGGADAGAAPIGGERDLYTSADYYRADRRRPIPARALYRRVRQHDRRRPRRRHRRPMAAPPPTAGARPTPQPIAPTD